MPKSATPEQAPVQFSTKGQKKPNADFRQINPKAIHVVKGHNPRTDLGDLTDLTNAIKSDGLQHPITVREKEDQPGHYELLVGERRWTVIKELGWDTIPAIVRSDLYDEHDALVAAVAENSDDARKELNAIDLGNAFLRLSKAGYSVQKIAKVTGFNHQKVRRCLTLVDKKTPTDIKDAVASGALPVMSGIELAKLDKTTRGKVIEDVGGQLDNLTFDAVRKSIKKVTSKTSETTPGKANQKKGATRDASLRAWRTKTEKQNRLSFLCAHFLALNDDKESIGTAHWFGVFQIIAQMLWDRGDVQGYAMEDGVEDVRYLVPDLDDAATKPGECPAIDEESIYDETDTKAANNQMVAEAKKDMKRMWAIIKEEAKGYDPAAYGEETEEEDAEEEAAVEA